MSLVSLDKYLEAYEIFPSGANLFFLGCIVSQLHHMKCINTWKIINIAKTAWCDNLSLLTVVNTSYILHFLKVEFDIFIISSVIRTLRGKELFTPIRR